MKQNKQLTTNHVGADDSVRLKQHHGITLIALIITIIILLILAMVTINILINQSIIGHANNAVHLYNEAQNNELAYLTYAEGEMDKYAGGNKDNGEQSTEVVPDLLQKYIMGAEGTGRKLEDIFETKQGRSGRITIQGNLKNDEDSITDASTTVEYLERARVDRTYWYYWVKYNDKVYRIISNGQDIGSITQGVKLVYMPKEKKRKHRRGRHSKI